MLAEESRERVTVIFEHKAKFKASEMKAPPIGGPSSRAESENEDMDDHDESAMSEDEEDNDQQEGGESTDDDHDLEEEEDSSGENLLIMPSFLPIMIYL